MLIRSRRALAAVVAIHAVVASIAALGAATPAPDFDRYYEIATTRGRPYLDFQVEHPIGTLLTFKALAASAGTRPRFALAVIAVNVAADAVVLGALVWGWGVAAAVAFGILVLPILDLLFNRIDLWSTACATVAAAAWQRDRPNVTAIGAVLGGAFKLWPLAFLVLLACPRRRGAGSIRPILVGFGVFVAVLAAWIGVAGLRGVYEVVTFRGATGWQIESIVGSLLHFAGASSIRLESGSWRIGRTHGAVSIALFLLAAPAYLWSIWRGARADRLGAGWLAGVASLLVCSALISAQFAGWLVPGAAIAWSQKDRRLAGWAASAVVLTGIFWKWYWAVLQDFPPLVAVVVVRNAVLVGLAVAGLRMLARSAVESNLQSNLSGVAVVERPEGR